MSRKKTVGLIAFLKGSTDPKAAMPGCAYYDRSCGGCLTWGGCLVQQGKRCGYFEKAVLPAAKDIGLLPHIRYLYEQHVGIDNATEPDEGDIRRCSDCGRPLKPRRKYCDSCRRKRRQKANRLNQRKYYRQHKTSS